MPHLSLSTLAIGARQLVVHEALEMIASPLYFVWFTPKTNIGVSSFDGADRIDLLRAGIEVLLRGGLVEEQAGRFDDDVGADFVPLQVGRIAFLGQADLLAVDDQRVALDRHVALEAAVHGVVAAACRPGSPAPAGR